ncbi:MAG: hypothetical protein LYZ69_01570 [Nitrososphaerales archaeon]|nr:hypothetical protein [Nitrososphaerales archaeon]
MKSSATALLVLGVIVALVGLTFALQGLSMVGPVGGLMYNNSTWVTQGSLTCVIGIVLIVAAYLLNRQPAAAPT